MAARTFNFTDMPIIIILGSTATGKSKLGIGLAKALNGEIISADSMQVYQGLNIITNKVTADEQREIPHHMINIVEPPQEFSVVQFKDMAMDIIKDLHTRNKIPIVVGGTNYYIESLLWDFLVDSGENEESDVEECLQKRKNLITIITHGDDTNVGAKDVYERLREVDPRRAEQLHPNNVRKIARSLQIYNSTGRTHSDLLNEQKTKHGSSHLSGPLRFSKALVFWLTCSQDVLDQRISDRMEKMVDEGLKHEISQFYKQYRVGRKFIPIIKTMNDENTEAQTGENTNDNIETGTSDSHNIVSSHECNVSSISTTISDIHTVNSGPDLSQQSEHSIEGDEYEEGLFQAIGFKEFHSFITSTENDLEKLDTLFHDGLEKLKRITIKYSKKQQRWVRHRFLARPDHSVPNIYELNATNLEKWSENVLEKSLQIANAFIMGESIPFSPLEKSPLSLNTDKNRKYVCEECNGRIIIGDNAWQAHVASKKHKKLRGKKRKLNPEEDIVT